MQAYFGRASSHFRIWAAILDLVTVEVWGEEIFLEGVGIKWKNGPGRGEGKKFLPHPPLPPHLCTNPLPVNHLRWRHGKPNLLSSVPLQNNACTAGYHIIKIFIFPSDPIFHAMNFSEKKNFWFGYKTILLWMFKNLKILFSCGQPVPLITASTCSELWRRFRNMWIQAWLNSLVLYLCKFCFIVHAKCSFPAFCMNY